MSAFVRNIQLFLFLLWFMACVVLTLHTIANINNLTVLAGIALTVSIPFSAWLVKQNYQALLE